MSLGEGRGFLDDGLGARHRARPRLKVSDEILATVRREILSGRLARGARLPNEKDLAQRFGVSQPTIREAVRALEAMGLVDVRHGSGAWVTGNSNYLIAAGLEALLHLEQVNLVDAIDVRKMLGLESVRLAAQIRTDDELEEIRTRLDALAAVGELSDVDAIIARIAAFQIAVSRAAHNPILLALESFIIQLQMQVQVNALKARGARYWRDRSLSFQRDRDRIFRALDAQNVPAAVKAMETYLEHTRQAFASDPALKAMRLTDKRASETVAAIVMAIRDA